MEVPKNILWRAGLIYLGTTSIAVWIFIAVIALQFNATLKAAAEPITYRWRPIEALPGDILAHDGRVMVSSVLSYDLVMDATVAQDSVFKYELKPLSEKLADLFGDKSAAEYEEQIRKARESRNYNLQLGDRKLTFTEWQEVKKYPVLKYGPRKKTGGEGWWGGGLTEEHKTYERVRYYGNIAERTFGRLSEEGKYIGLEGNFIYALKGVPGKRYVEIAKGRNIPVSHVPEIPPSRGYDLVTTIDIDMHDAAETALRRLFEDKNSNVVFEAGCAVVMEVQTGAIRAITNLSRRSAGNYSDEFNHAVGTASEPGSVFKLYALLALLEDGKVTLNDVVDTDAWDSDKEGVRIRDKIKYGKITVARAFELSSNNAFMKLVKEHYSGKEVRRFLDRLYSLGLARSTNLQIPGEAKQRVHYPGDKHWHPTSLPYMPVGYEAMNTPLKTLTVYNAVANNGRMMKPLFATALKDGNRIVESFSPEELNPSICQPSTIMSLRKAMEGVVRNGTAKSINRDSTIYRIAGKTGTAFKENRIKGDPREGERSYQASFVGYFPADQPKYSMIVVLYSESANLTDITGGRYATRVFKEISDKIYAQSPDWATIVEPAGELMLADLIAQNISRTAPETVNDHVVPSVKGMLLKDAVYILENRGLSVSSLGAGRVAEQTLAPGTKITAGMKIHLDLK